MDLDLYLRKDIQYVIVTGVGGVSGDMLVDIFRRERYLRQRPVFGDFHLLVFIFTRTGNNR